MLKTKQITLNDRGEDRTFVVTEMPVTRLQRFIIRFAIVAAGSGILQIDVANTAPDDVMGVTAGALRSMDLSKLAMIDPDRIQPLLDELLTCVSYRVGNHDTPMSPEIVDSYISDIRTLWTLYKEIVMLHFDFLQNASSSGMTSPDQQQPLQLQQPSLERPKKNTSSRKTCLR